MLPYQSVSNHSWTGVYGGPVRAREALFSFLSLTLYGNSSLLYIHIHLSNDTSPRPHLEMGEAVYVNTVSVYYYLYWFCVYFFYYLLCLFKTVVELL